MKIKIPKLPFKTIFIFLVIFLLGIGVGTNYVAKLQNQSQASVEKNTPKAFVSEVYDKIKDNYWDNISDAQLLDLFKLSIDKNGGNLAIAKFENKDQLLSAISKNTLNLPAVVSSVLAFLSPAGRSSLYTQALEQQLKNTVSNINPEKDLYKDLGLPKGASEEAVLEAYKKLAVEATPEKLKTIAYAKDTLTQKETKQNYAYCMSNLKSFLQLLWKNSRMLLKVIRMILLYLH